MSTASPGIPDSLAGRHAVVTGASRGIGAAIARRLAGSGAAVSLLGRDEAALGQVAASLDGGAPVATIAADLADPAQLATAFAQARDRLGPVHILVNNAGIALSAPLHKETLAQWERLFAINVTAAFLGTQAVLGDMRAAGWGRIINIASIAGLAGAKYIAAYTASKHALVGLTRAAAAELAGTPITVNAICPGYTDTDIVARTIETITTKTGRTAEEARAELAAGNPQGRLIDPDEVAALALFLTRAEARSITGQALVVAGGQVGA